MLGLCRKMDFKSRLKHTDIVVSTHSGHGATQLLRLVCRATDRFASKIIAQLAAIKRLQRHTRPLKPMSMIGSMVVLLKWGY